MSIDRFQILNAFRKSVDQSAFVLEEKPDLIFSQVYNRLQGRASSKSDLKQKLDKEKNRVKKVWFDLSSKPKASQAYVRTMTGHSETVNDCVFSPDGKRLYSASLNEIMFWNVQTGEELATYPEQFFGGITALDISPDGRILAVVGDKLIIVETETGKEHSGFFSYTGMVLDCAFNPDGSRIVTAGRNKTLDIWDVKTGKSFRSLDGHTTWILSCDFSPDGKNILSGSLDGILKFWDAESGEEIWSIQAHKQKISSCKFSPDGFRILTASEDHTIKLWDASTGKEILSRCSKDSDVSHSGGLAGWISDCAFSPDNKTFVSACSDRTLKLWDAKSGELLKTYTGHSGTVITCCFSPDGRWLASGGKDKTIRIWDIETHEEEEMETGHSLRVQDCYFSPDGSRIVSCSVDKTVKLWDGEDGNEISTLGEHSYSVLKCLYNPEGNSVFSQSFYEIIKWDVENPPENTVLVEHHGINDFDVTPDGQILMYAGGWFVAHLDSNTGRKIKTVSVKTKSQVDTCKFSPDGTRFLTKSHNILKLWAAENGDEVATLEEQKWRIGDFAFSPDSKLIVCASGDPSPVIWDGKTGNVIATLEGHDLRIGVIVFSPDSNLIIAGSSNVIRMWNARTGKELRVLMGHSEAVTRCAFSPDGRYIISTSKDGSLRLWNTISGDELTAFMGFFDEVTCFDVSPDGSRIVLGDMQGHLGMLRIKNI